MNDYTTLYDDEGILILFDPNDSLCPYAVDDGGDRVWLSPEQTDALVRHRFQQTGQSLTSDDLVRASSVTFNEGVMRLAAVHDKTVTFRYAKGDGSTIETRTLQPESVFTNKQGDVLFGGTDPDRDEYRAYRIDRIKGEVTVA